MCFPGFLRAFVLFGLVMAMGVAPAFAQPGRVLIRDTEIETSLREWSKGVTTAAGLTPEQVRIILVQSPDVNAFVAGGPNIFIYTGLIQKSENPGEVVGVIAHELGHIAGGHLVRTRAVADNASFEAMLATVLGIGVAVLSGDGGAAAAGTAIGQSAGLNRFLSHSRVQESSSDQAAMKFLETAQINPTGLVSFLNKLSSEELLDVSQQSAYMRTHPITSDRIEALKTRLEQSALKDQPYPANWVEQHARMKAKLLAFISPQQVTLAYPSSNPSFAARYARAIAAYRQNRLQEALSQVDELIQEEPDNPYLYELKGQALYENGRIKESVAPYQKALDLKPQSGLIRMYLAQAIMEASPDPSAQKRAMELLKRAERDEPRTTRIKRLLATAAGRLGQEAQARVYLAEEAFMQGRKGDARALANAALKGLPAQSPETLRARDVITTLDQDGEQN